MIYVMLAQKGLTNERAPLKKSHTWGRLAFEAALKSIWIQIKRPSGTENGETRKGLHARIGAPLHR